MKPANSQRQAIIPMHAPTKATEDHQQREEEGPVEQEAVAEEQEVHEEKAHEAVVRDEAGRRRLPIHMITGTMKEMEVTTTTWATSSSPPRQARISRRSRKQA